MTKRFINAAIATSAILSVPKIALAQSDTNLPEIRLPDVPSRRLDDVQIPELPSPPIELDSPAPRFTPATPQTRESIVVADINFIGNKAISSEALADLATPYIGREVTFTDLLQLQSEITNFYIQQGYITSVANLFTEENQGFDPQNALFTFEIIEGQIEEIRIEDVSRLERYVRERIEQATSPAFNQPRLEEAIRFLQVDPLIQSVSANLTAGNRSNSNIIVLNIEPSPRFEASVSADNTRSPLSGQFQQDVKIRASNLLSLGESASVGYSRTEGSNQYSLDLSIPTNTQDGRLGFEFISFDSRITQEPFNAFDIESQSSAYKVTYRQPIKRAATASKVEELVLGISAARLESSSSIENIPFPLSPGADTSGQTRVNEIGFFQEYQRLSSQSVAIARSEVGVGLDMLNSTTGDGFNDNYLLWRGQAAWLRQVGNSRLSVQSEVQLTGDKLVPLTQFSLGRLRAAQGFRQFSLLSDNGFIASVDFQVPVVESPVKVTVVPFFEAGLGWNNGSERALQNDLFLAPGIGLQLDIDGLSAGISYAVPLTDLNGATGSRLGFQFGYQNSF